MNSYTGLTIGSSMLRKRKAFSNFINSGFVSASTFYFQADTVLARSFLNSNQLKGTLSEHFAENYFLTSQFEKGIRGNWVSITPRSGPQGLDHLFVRVGKNGKFSWMVGETKFGSSQLSKTVDGNLQFSETWTKERINKLAEKYLALNALDDVGFKDLPDVAAPERYDIPLNNKDVVSFWKDHDDKWYFAGGQNKLSKALTQANRMADSLSSPDFNPRYRLYHVNSDGSDLKISIIKLDSGADKPLSSYLLDENTKTITVSGILDKNISDKELIRHLAKALKNKLPNIDSKELNELANDIAQEYKNGDLLKTQSIWEKPNIKLLTNSLQVGVVSFVSDLLFQLIFKKDKNVSQSLLKGISAFAGSIVGQLLNRTLLTSVIGTNIIRGSSKLLHVNSCLLRRSVSGLAGGVLTSILISYGGYFLGFTDLKTAHISAISGVAGAAGGVLAGIGITSIVGAVGVTSTGTAIGTLSGAAATKATLAWLGGGAISAGGGGIALGYYVLGSITGGCALIVSLAVPYIYSAYSEKEERNLYLMIGNNLKENEALEAMANRTYKVFNSSIS